MGLKVSRRLGEQIEIDGGITITVKSFRGSQILLEIDAPAEIGIRYKHLSKNTAHDRAKQDDDRSCLIQPLKKLLATSTDQQS